MNEISGAKSGSQNAQNTSLPIHKDISHELYSTKKSPQLRDLLEGRSKDHPGLSIYEQHRSPKEPDNSKLGISVAGTSSLGILGMKSNDTSNRDSSGSGTLSNIQKKIKIMLSGQSGLMPKERPASNQSGLASRVQNQSGVDQLQETVTANREKDKQTDDSKNYKTTSKKPTANARTSEPASVLAGISMKLLSRGRDTDPRSAGLQPKPSTSKAVDTSNKDHGRKFFGENTQGHLNASGINSKTLDAKSYIEKALGKSSIQESFSKRGIASSLATHGAAQYKLPTDHTPADSSSHPQQNNIKNNPLYQRFSQKLAAKTGYESTKEQPSTLVKDIHPQPDNSQLGHQKNQSFNMSGKVGIASVTGASQKYRSGTLAETDLRGQQDIPPTDKNASGIEGAIHKRAESENLKKLFSSTTDQLNTGVPSKLATKPTLKGGVPSKPDEREEEQAKPAKEKQHVQSKSINLSTTLASLKAAAASKKSSGSEALLGSQKHSLSKGVPMSHGGLKQTKPFATLETIKRMESALPQFESAKVIVKDFGKVRAFAVNTHQGLVRSYNEDRVSILLNAQQR